MNSQQPGSESKKTRKKLSWKTISGKNPHSFGILSIVTLTIIVIAAFLWLNEILDIPHYVFGAPKTPVNLSEAAIETAFILGFGVFVLLILKSNIDRKRQSDIM